MHADAAQRPKVLLVDTLSSANDFGVELPIALDPIVDLTVFTIKGTRLRPGDCQRIIEAFPEFWGPRGKAAKLFDQMLATLRLAGELWRHRQHVVHVQFFRSMAFELPLYMLMRPFLKTLVCTVHNALPHERRWWHRLVYRRWYALLDRAHVLSRHTGEQLVAEFGVNPQSIVLAPHGNYSRFMGDFPPAAAVDTRSRLGVDPDTCLVLLFGLIHPYKGVDRLVAAVGRIAEPHVHVLIAGGCAPDLQADIRTRIAALQTSARVDFQPGFLGNQAMSDLISAADLVVFPYHHIYQSGALLMAMTYGSAIVASELAGFREYLDPGVTAMLCNTADASAFAQVIDGLAADPQARDRIAHAVGLVAHERFAWPVVARTLAAAYGD